MQNVKRIHYNYDKSIINNEFLGNGMNNKINFNKEIIINQNNNIPYCEKINNSHFVKFDKFLTKKIKSKNLVNKKNSNSYNTYYRNLNFINTLYQNLNTNEQIEKINNYFSNRDELSEFIKNNRINNKINIKNDIILRKNITKSEAPIERRNILSNLEEKCKEKKKYNNSERNKIDNNFSENSLSSKKKKNNKNYKKIELNKIKHINNLIKINKLGPKTPKNSSINIGKNSLLNSEKKVNESKKVKKVNSTKREMQLLENNNNNKDNINNNTTRLKTIKLFDKNKINFNNENSKNFEKVNGTYGDCRYFNVFEYEEEDLSLAKIESDYSGMIDSSNSNEIQINPDFFIKESPKNVFKGEQIENQSNKDSNDNEI